jgi:hypothetical protein
MERELREHLLELLEGTFAHIDLESALDGFPVSEINTRLPNSPHTAWELVEHIRLAQWDILEFSRDAKHVSPDFPDGYWNKEEASPDDWKASAKQVLADLEEMRELVRDKNVDLFAKIAHGEGQTILREVLLVADHNAYHLGQLMLLRRTLENKQ